MGQCAGHNSYHASEYQHKTYPFMTMPHLSIEIASTISREAGAQTRVCVPHQREANFAYSSHD